MRHENKFEFFFPSPWPVAVPSLSNYLPIEGFRLFTKIISDLMKRKQPTPGLEFGSPSKFFTMVTEFYARPCG